MKGWPYSSSVDSVGDWVCDYMCEGVAYSPVDPVGLRLARQDPLYEAIFTCTGNPVRTVGTQVRTVGTQVRTVGTQVRKVGTQVRTVGNQVRTVDTQVRTADTQVRFRPGISDFH